MSDDWSKASDEGAQPAQGRGLDAVADPRPVHVAPDQPGLFEHLRVLRHRRLGERQIVHDIAANTRIFSHQKAEDLDPRRVPERLREARQLLVSGLPFDRPEVDLDAFGGQQGSAEVIVVFNASRLYTRLTRER